MSTARNLSEGGAIDGFTVYNTQANARDTKFVDGCNSTMDTLLVFAGLFSAIVTAFIVQFTNNDQSQTNELLTHIVKKNNDENYHADLTNQAQSVSAMLVNLFLFCSLTITLLAALMAMLVKQWAHSFIKRTRRGVLAQEKARSRRRARTAVERWNLDAIISTVPILLHIGLAFFFVSMLLWLFSNEQLPIFIAVMTLTGIGFVLYAIAATIGLHSQDAPFQWPVVALLRRLTSPRTPVVPIYDKKPAATFKNDIVVSTRARSEAERLLLEFNSEDTAISYELVSASVFIADTCSGLSQLRSLMLLSTFDARIGFDHPRHLPSPRVLAIQKCVSIADSVISYSGGLRWLQDDAVFPARAVCEFLEVYLQLGITDDECDKVMNGPTINFLCEALQNQACGPRGRIHDFALATSVRALHSHQVLRPTDGCSTCFYYSEGLRDFLFGDRGLLANGEQGMDREQLAQAHRSLRVVVTSMTQCLFFHWKGTPKWDEISFLHARRIKDGFARLTTATQEMEMYEAYINTLQTKTNGDISKTEWLNAVKVEVVHAIVPGIQPIMISAGNRAPTSPSTGPPLSSW